MQALVSAAHHGLHMCLVLELGQVATELSVHPQGTHPEEGLRVGQLREHEGMHHGLNCGSEVSVDGQFFVKAADRVEDRLLNSPINGSTRGKSLGVLSQTSSTELKEALKVVRVLLLLSGLIFAEIH